MVSNVVTIHKIKNGQDGQNGQPCKDGKDGKYITKTVVMYYLSTSSTAPTGGSWSEVLSYSSGKYVWTRYRYSWSDGSADTYSTPVLDRYIAMMGKKATYIGEDGIYTGTLAADTVVASTFALEKGTVGGWSIDKTKLSAQKITEEDDGLTTVTRKAELSNSGSLRLTRLTGDLGLYSDSILINPDGITMSRNIRNAESGIGMDYENGFWISAQHNTCFGDDEGKTSVLFRPDGTGRFGSWDFDNTGLLRHTFEEINKKPYYYQTNLTNKRCWYSKMIAIASEDEYDRWEGTWVKVMGGRIELGDITKKRLKTQTESIPVDDSMNTHVVIRADGSGEIAGGGIYWESDGEMFFSHNGKEYSIFDIIDALGDKITGR